jgi:hypothetical protein
VPEHRQLAEHAFDAAHVALDDVGRALDRGRCNLTRLTRAAQLVGTARAHAHAAADDRLRVCARRLDDEQQRLADRFARECDYQQ